MNIRFRAVLLVVVALLISVPASIVITLLLLPFWSWLEASFGFESIGHSGPAQWCYVAVFAIFSVGLLLALWILRRHRRANARSLVDDQGMTDPVWCVVANVVTERPYGPDGAERRVGTKHFRAGAKLHIIDAYSGMCENVIAIGHHRGSNQYCRMVVSVRHLENFRVKLAYSPEVIRLANEHFATGPNAWSEKRARQMCNAFPHWQQQL